MKKFTAVFLALVVCLSLVFYFPVSRVSASEVTDYFTGSLPDSITKESCDSVIEQANNQLFSSGRYGSIDDYILFAVNTYLNRYFFFKKSDVCDGNTFNIEFWNNRLYFTTHSTPIQPYYPNYQMFGNTFSTDYTGNFYVDSDYKIYNDSSTSSSCKTNSLYTTYFIPFYCDFMNTPELSFTVEPQLSIDMNLSDVGGSVTVTATNDTDTAYDYIMYVSKSPSDIGVINSMYDTTYAASSLQWCYTKQTDATIPPDLKQTVKDKISDEFKTIDIMDIVTGPGAILYNIWGGSFKAAEQYFSYHEDYLTYYSKTQTNCPVYLINPHTAKEHTLYFSSFNINLNETFYFNIIYKEHSSNVVSSVGASASALLDAAGGEYDAPIFNTQDFTSFRSYNSIPFSVVDGYVPVTNKDDITGYPGITYYSNPDNSVANITNDNSVHINDSFNNTYVPGGDGSGTLNPSGTVINGVVVNGTAYFNYGNNNYPGVILPGGSSGSGSSAPELPEADFKKLYDESGDFFEFFKDLIESSGFLPVTLFSSACIVALFMRIWGR